MHDRDEVGNASRASGSARTTASRESGAAGGETSEPHWIIPLSRSGKHNRHLVGGKAENLGVLLQANLPVPSGFCLTTAAFQRFVDASPTPADLSSILARMVSARSDQTVQLSEQLVARLSGVEIPASVEAAVLSAWRNQGEDRDYAVRSSATVEDAAEHSFAGQFDSYLNVRGQDELLSAVRDCWLSLFSPRALAYCAREHLPVAQMSMAVVIQEMVPAEIAGVAFTVDPLSGNAGRMVIEGAPGLGDRLIAGQVTPETVVLEKRTLRVVEHRTESSPSCLSESLCRQVGKLALEVEGLFGRPVDMEWAARDGKVFLLQARAVTGLTPGRSGQGATSSETCPPTVNLSEGRAPRVLESFSVQPRVGLAELVPPKGGSWEDRQVWTNVNTGEVMPDVMTPVTWSMIQEFLRQLAGSFFRLAGAEVNRGPLVGLVGGRLYFNVNTALAAIKPFERVLRRVPRLEQALGGGHLNLAQPGLLELSENDLPDLGFGWGKYLLSLPGVVRTLIVHSPRRGDAWTARLKADNDARVPEDYALLSVAELSQRLQLLLQEGFRGWDLLYLGTQAVSLVVFEKACREWLDDPDLAMGYRLFSGLGGIPEAEAGLSLWRLALLAHADRETESAVLEGGEWSAIQTRRSSAKHGQRFLDAWEQFMSEHGHHCRGELELFNARWSERPDYILGVVRGYLTALDHANPLENHQRLAREREQLTERCRHRLRNPIKRWIFMRSLKRAQKLAVNREEWKSQAVRLLTIMRRVLLALGERLAAGRILGQSGDIFFLELAEIQVVAANQADFDVRAVVRQRRETYARNLTLAPPPVVFGRFKPADHDAPIEEGNVETWQGIPVFPGLATGRARVILRTDDHEQVLPGEILVAPFTDPAWTPYFVTAAAVVMDQGGILSHGSIVAREYGLPAVTNVGTATQNLRTGDWIEVDGNRGRVRLLKPA